MCGCGSNSSTGRNSNFRHTHEANFNASFNPTLALAVSGETFPEPSLCRSFMNQAECEGESLNFCTWHPTENICYNELDIISGDISVANLMIPATLWNFSGGGGTDCAINPYACDTLVTEDQGGDQRQSLVSTLAM